MQYIAYHNLDLHDHLKLYLQVETLKYNPEPWAVL